jgi:hypothetical protein
MLLMIIVSSNSVSVSTIIMATSTVSPLTNPERLRGHEI